MVTALCFITAAPHRVNEVGSMIARLPEARTVYSVTGEWDIIVVLEVREVDDVARVVTDQIGALDGIVGTETHIAFRTYSPEDVDAGFALGY
ncbi:MAG: Lrp/AsnC family transcriptional regulator [Actinomycetales bacterium]|nr:Lrp/AsnC family transcriptional regulator [Actinomycetales bacterium]